MSTETTLTIPDEAWRVYLVGSPGFVLDIDPEILIEHIDDEDWIDREYGDSQPRRIVVVRRSAIPKPQSPGSEFLRMPGSHLVDDHFQWELDDEEPERARMLWRAAHGFAYALNIDALPARYILGDAGDTPPAAEVLSDQMWVIPEPEDRTGEVLRQHREDWASWLESWQSAVGPEPPTIDAVIRWLRADSLPFGRAANPEASS